MCVHSCVHGGSYLSCMCDASVIRHPGAEQRYVLYSSELRQIPSPCPTALPASAYTITARSTFAVLLTVSKILNRLSTMLPVYRSSVISARTILPTCLWQI